MAFEDKKGIIVASPFKLQAEALLDVRQQVDTIAERDRLVTLKAATAGLRVFVKENSTSYVYTGSKWDPLVTGAPYKHPTGDGNHHVPATGTTNAGKYLKAGATAGSEAWSSISAGDITGLPTKLPNPQALKFTGAATATYDGSGAVTVNIPTSGTTDAALTLQMNGGTTEGTNKFTFNGAAAKTVNITPALIGAAAASHTHASSQITGLPTSLKNPYALTVKTNGSAAATYDGSAAKEVNITAASIGAAAASHGHSAFKGATSSAAGGAGFVPAPGTGENTKYLRGDGTWQAISLTLAALGVTATAAELNYMKGVTSAVQTQLNGKAASSHTHTASQITGLPTKLPNPDPIKFTGAVTATYDGSGAVTVNIPTSGTTDASLTLQMNGGATEGTNKFTFNGSAAKTVNITPGLIGAAAASHTHPTSQITGLPTSLKNPYALTVKTNGTSAAVYDGSAAKEVNITASSVGAAAASHGHSTFKGATASAAGGTGFVPTPGVGENNKYLRGDGTWQPISLTLAALGVTATAAELNYMKGVTSAVQTQLNGKAAASHSHSGYAPTNHTHNYAGSSSAGGSANSAVKLATARTINGVAFDGTKNISIPNNYSKQLTSEDLNSVLTPGNYFAADGNTVKNKPSSVNGFGLEIYKISATYTVQRLHGSDNIIYHRYHNGTSFSSWSDTYSSANKPTPTEIGAAAASHTHSNYAPTSHTHTASQITGLPTSLKNPYALTVKTNGTAAATYDGSAAKEVNITPASIGAAATSHTHNYAGSSSAGGAANSAKKVDVPVGTILWSTSSSSTFFKATMGGTWEVLGKIEALVNASSTVVMYIHKKTAL